MAASVTLSTLAVGAIAVMPVKAAPQPDLATAGTISLSTQRSIAPNQQFLDPVNPNLPVQQMGMLDMLPGVVIGGIILIGGALFFSSITGLVIIGV